MKKRICAFLLIIVFAFGCAPKRTRVARRVALDPQARATLAALDERRAAITSFRAMGKATLTTIDEQTADVVVVLKMPDKMRIEAVDDVADVVASIASNGSRISASLPHEQRRFAGRASRSTMKRLMGIEWSMDDMVGVLVGIAPLPAKPFLERQTEGHGRFMDTANKIELWMDMQRLVPLRFIQYSDTGGIAYDIRFGRYRNVQEVLIPHHIIAINPSSSERVEIRYREVELNQPTQARTFDAAT